VCVCVCVFCSVLGGGGVRRQRGVDRYVHTGRRHTSLQVTYRRLTRRPL